MRPLVLPKRILIAFWLHAQWRDVVSNWCVKQVASLHHNLRWESTAVSARISWAKAWEKNRSLAAHCRDLENRAGIAFGWSSRVHVAHSDTPCDARCALEVQQNIHRWIGLLLVHSPAVVDEARDQKSANQLQRNVQYNFHFNYLCRSCYNTTNVERSILASV